jgi:hypothetical protein
MCGRFWGPEPSSMPGSSSEGSNETGGRPFTRVSQVYTFTALVCLSLCLSLSLQNVGPVQTDALSNIFSLLSFLKVGNSGVRGDRVPSLSL